MKSCKSAKNTNKPSSFIRNVVLSLIIVISITGVSFSWFELQVSKKALSNTMLTTAMMLSTTLDKEKISRLKGSLTDLKSNDFTYLRNQIIRIQKINPNYRYLYLFGKTNKPHPIFLMSTGQEGTSDFSPPGLVYFEDSPSLNEVYNTLQPLVGTPFTDRWGTWVSPLIPITDSKSGKLIAVFGMDVDASDFQKEIFQKSLIPLMVSALCIVLLVVGFVILRKRQLSSHIEILKQTEAALRESAEYQRVLFTDSQQALVVMDDDTEKFIDCNKAAVNLYGFNNRNELIGLTPSDVSTPIQYNGNDSQSEAKIKINECRNHSDIEFGWRSLKPNGQIWDAYVHLMQFEYRGKQMIQFSITDITDRKQSEDALRKSEERNRAILSVLPDMMFVFDKQGVFVDLYADDNQKLYSKPELAIGKNIKEILPGYLAELTISFIDKVFETGVMQVFQYDLEINGLVRYYEARLVLKSKEEVLSIVTDITDRIKVKTEHEKLQNQFIQSQKMESIGRLAGGVAHDFNNMLQAILGHSELALLDVEPSSSVHSNLIEIYKAAERSADLTRQLLAFARKQTVLPRVINLNETVESMIKLLKRLMGEDIDLIWLPKADLWQIRIDPSQIDQIMANLCVNARDAITGVGQVIIETENITIETTPYLEQTQMEPGSYVMLAISDNGHGMTADVKDHIFEPFFTTKGLGEGTGLGLATVYGIVKQNNGFINVYSELNKGTTFKIYFPRYSGANDISVINTDQNEIQNGSETLLIVEDEPSILKMSTTMLVQLGYNVLFATNPSEALKIALEHSGEIHLLITDVIMPNLNGWDLAQKLQGDYPSMKCLFMSGYTSTVITSQGLLHESTNFIQKPFSLRSLGAKVREVLDYKENIKSEIIN